MATFPVRTPSPAPLSVGKKLQKTHTNPAQVKQVENCRCESFLLDLSSYFSANHTWTLRNIDFIPSSRSFALHVCIYDVFLIQQWVWQQNWSEGLYFLKLRTLFRVYCRRNTNNTPTLLFILPPEHRQPYIRLSWRRITHTFLLLFFSFGGKQEGAVVQTVMM